MTNTQYTKYPPTLSWITLMCTKNSNHHHSGKRQCHSILQLLTFFGFYRQFCHYWPKNLGEMSPPLQLHGCKYLRDDQNWTFVRTVHGIHPYREIILQKFPIQYSVIGGYSHLVPAGTFRVSVLVGFVCPCIMLCLSRVLHRLAAHHVIACSTEQPIYLSCRGA